MPPLTRWTLHANGGDYSRVIFGPDVPGTLIVEMPAWAAEHVVREHNAQVDAASRPTVEVEKMLTRVAVATVRELVRGLLPRRLRRRR